MSSLTLDPGVPPIELLPVLGPDAPERGEVSYAEAIGYCRGLATSHYENFSVLTALVPDRLRDDFAAVYAFCRWADDLGDETGNTPEARTESERLLEWWREELRKCFGLNLGGTALRAARREGEGEGQCEHTEQNQISSARPGGPCHPVFVALRETARRHPHLNAKPFEDLIDAFAQDQRVGIGGVDGNRYKTWEQVVDYCTRSANPVGRIVLTLGGYAPPEVDPSNAERYAMSDATCTALQLINFWQDVRRDLLERDRVYIPEETGITAEMLRAWANRPDDPSARVPFIRAVRPLVDHTAEMFDQGRPLPGMLDRDLAPVVWLFGAGGDAILSAVRGIGCATLWERPRLGKRTKAWLVGRAWMKKALGTGADSA